MSNMVLDYFREKHPDLKGESDSDLTFYIADRHPQFLVDEPDFAKRYQLEVEKKQQQQDAGKRNFYSVAGDVGDGIQWGFKKLNWAMSVIPASVADLAEKTDALRTTPDNQGGVLPKEMPEGFKNLKAWWHGAATSQQPTYQKIAESEEDEGFWTSVAQKVSRAGSDLLPRLLLLKGAGAVGLGAAGVQGVTGLSAGGVAAAGVASAPAALAFGASEEGLSASGAAVGAGFPVAQQIGKKAAGVILGKLGGGRLPTVAQKVVEEASGLGAIQALNEAMAAPERVKQFQENPKQFWSQVAADTVVNSMFLLHSMPSMKAGVPSETQRYLSMRARRSPSLPPDLQAAAEIAPNAAKAVEQTPDFSNITKPAEVAPVFTGPATTSTGESIPEAAENPVLQHGGVDITKPFETPPAAGEAGAVAVEKPVPPPTGAPGEAKGADWIRENAESVIKLMPKETQAKIEALAAQRKTAKEIADALGLDSQDVGYARIALKIPSQTEGAGPAQSPNPEFEIWKQNYDKRTNTGLVEKQAGATAEAKVPGQEVPKKGKCR